MSGDDINTLLTGGTLPELPKPDASLLSDSDGDKAQSVHETADNHTGADGAAVASTDEGVREVAGDVSAGGSGADY